jgi:DNA-binding CsgD family transcriptional regulator
MIRQTGRMTSSVERARTAFARQDWAEAFSTFTAAAEGAPLEAADHEHLAICAYLVGRDDDSAKAWEAAQQAAAATGDPREAARCAFWLSFILMLRGQMAHAAGWLTRTERLIKEVGEDCPASGYVLVPRFLGALQQGDPSTARELAARAAEVGDRFGDADLRALGTLGHGQALIASGDVASGVAQLDAVMVAVTGDEVGPVVTGIVYCAVILECMSLFDLRRAAEWTHALDAWCDAQPDLVPYRGQCLVHRSQLQQAAGDWPDAISTAAAACRRLTDPPHPALGLACYQEGELHRLIGAFEQAELDYRQASRHGYDPVPGLALLQLARGNGAAAAAGIQRALYEVRDAPGRPALLAAAVDILCSTGDLSAARSAADELWALADAASSPVLDAMAAQATGTVLMCDGDPATALPRLRTAATVWQSLRMPYEAARAAILVGRTCSALGDCTAAALEFDNARAAFSELGAGPDLKHVTALSDELPADSTSPAGKTETSLLSNREREVLAHLAAGRTNREIAAHLLISQHTVARHLENIYVKLGVRTRAAATAYAYEHDLV